MEGCSIERRIAPLLYFMVHSRAGEVLARGTPGGVPPDGRPSPVASQPCDTSALSVQSASGARGATAVSSGMRFDLDGLDARERYKLLTGTVVPRPIGWISTVDEQGRRNLAPFSYFQIASASPPVLSFSGGSRAGRPKDSVHNALATGGFVAHIADMALMEAMNATRVEAPHADVVAAPRVALAPVAFECELLHAYEVPEGGNTVVFGRVRVAHVRDDLVQEDGRIDVRALDPLARLSGTLYAALGQIVDLPRPVWQDLPSD